MRANHGFTLIETIVVIVILGALAAIALPRFINLSSDANRALVENMAANFNAAMQFVEVQKRLQGSDTNPLDYNGTTLPMIAEFPQPSAPNARVLLETDFPTTTWTPDWKTVPCANSDFCVLGNRPSNDGSAPDVDGFDRGTGLFIWPAGKVLDDNVSNGDCFTYFINLGDGSAPLIGFEGSGC